MREIPDINEELLGKAAVEAQGMPDLGNRLLGGGGAGKIDGGIAWQSARQKKRHDDDADDAGYGR